MKHFFIIGVAVAAIWSWNGRAEETWQEIASKDDAKKLEEIPRKYEGVSGVSLQVEKVTKKDDHWWAQCRLINNSQQPVHFYGTDVTFPHSEREVQKGGEWEDVPLWYCGMSAYVPELPVGKSVCFESLIPDRGTWRVGLEYARSPDLLGTRSAFHAWSAPIEVK